MHSFSSLETLSPNNDLINHFKQIFKDYEAFVIDTNVLIKLVLNEDLHEAAKAAWLALIEMDKRICAPAVIMIEFKSVLLKRLKKRNTIDKTTYDSAVAYGDKLFPKLQLYQMTSEFVGTYSLFDDVVTKSSVPLTAADAFFVTLCCLIEEEQEEEEEGDDRDVVKTMKTMLLTYDKEMKDTAGVFSLEYHSPAPKKTQKKKQKKWFGKKYKHSK